MTLSDLIKEGVICFLTASDRNEALTQLVHALYKEDKIQNTESFYQAILKREEIVSTGVGMGVAIPHAKLNEFTHFFMAIGILKEGVEWHSLDGSPVRLIFMIGGPADQQTEYLQILSQVTASIKDQEIRKQLLNMQTPEEVIKLFPH